MMRDWDYQQRPRPLARSSQLELSLITRDFPIIIIPPAQSHDETCITQCSMKKDQCNGWENAIQLPNSRIQSNSDIKWSFAFITTKYNHFQNPLFRFPTFFSRSGSTYHGGVVTWWGPERSKWMCQKHQYINIAEGSNLIETLYQRAHENIYLQGDKYGT